jgi:hypothetical protein
MRLGQALARCVCAGERLGPAGHSGILAKLRWEGEGSAGTANDEAALREGEAPPQARLATKLRAGRVRVRRHGQEAAPQTERGKARPR